MNRPRTFGVMVGLALASGTLSAQPTVELERGVTAFNRGDYEAALATLRPEIGRSVRAARVYLQGLYTVGRYEDAERTAIPLVASTGAEPLLVPLGQVLEAEGKLDEARQAYEKAVRDGAPDRLTAQFRLAQLQYERGERDSAMVAFRSFIDVYNNRRGLGTDDLSAIASAARYVGNENRELFQDALRVYDEAIALDSTNLDALIAIGDLFLDKYNNADALTTFGQALARNPHHPAALLGMARSQHFDGRSEALATTQQSLETNPRYVPALVFLATLYLELEEYDRAEEQVQAALEVNPASLEALSALAAVRYLRGDRDGFAEVEARVRRFNPRYADLYSTLAELAARNRQYEDAVRLARRGVELDDRSWRAYGLLGLNLLRTGEMEEGRRMLETAFEGDPYNVWIKNTLDLSDTFGEYRIVSSDRFQIALHESEADLLAPYVTEVAEEAYDKLSRRYGIEAPSPIRIEVYPRHADFSVRTVGLAGMGALGVSFGPVIAMDSPSARQVGDFNWASTLWHELTHSFHLAMTDHRVPRWFTEGCAVYEERRSRDGWGWGDDVNVPFLLAYRDGKLLPVSEMNEGFVRPRYPEHVIHSYYQASLVCEYIEAEYGTEALLGMLRAYREGKTGGAVIEEVLGRTPDAFDEEFDQHLKTRFHDALAALGDMEVGGRGRMSEQEVGRWAEQASGSFPAQLTAGQVLFRAGRLNEATVYFERAKTLFPEYAGRDAPYWFLAQIDRQQGDLASAERELAALTAINGRHYAALLELAEVREEQGKPADAARALQRAMYIYPYEIEDHARLAALLGETGDWGDAVRERRAIVALAPVDMAEARYQLARAYFEAGDLASARREILRTLEAAPNYEEAQDLLLQIRERRRNEERR